MSKLLNVAAKEILRKEILNLCNQAVPIGCSMDVLAAAFAHAGDSDKGELERQVEYLEAKGLVTIKEVQNRQLNLHKKIVNITAHGIDFLEGNTEPINGIGV